jgi:hypothetical protein
VSRRWSATQADGRSAPPPRSRDGGGTRDRRPATRQVGIVEAARIKLVKRPTERVVVSSLTNRRPRRLTMIEHGSVRSHRRLGTVGWTPCLSSSKTAIKVLPLASKMAVRFYNHASIEPP